MNPICPAIDRQLIDCYYVEDFRDSPIDRDSPIVTHLLFTAQTLDVNGGRLKTTYWSPSHLHDDALKSFI